jgi:hypothetical protein
LVSRFTEPVYPRPDLPPPGALADYYRAAGPLMLPFLAKRPLNLFRCSGERCFYQRNRDHPPTGDGFFRPPIGQVPIAQKNGRTEDYLYVDTSRRYSHASRPKRSSSMPGAAGSAIWKGRTGSRSTSIPARESVSPRSGTGRSRCGSRSPRSGSKAGRS